jgi:RhtB (resistance to homoserine/threonine) family protein
MEQFISQLILLIGLMMVALVSPGPDFVMTVKNSILNSRRAGLMTALGLALGVIIHVTYCMVGLATVISKSILLFNIIKYVGAGYLIYIGIMALRSKGFDGGIAVENGNKQTMSDWQALSSGFITNLFNPKATMFFLAMFTQIVDPHVPLSMQFVYGITCFSMTFLWFSIVATILTVETVRSRFLRAAQWIDRICGAALIALGVRLAITKMN